MAVWQVESRKEQVMEYLLSFLIGTVITWVMLLIVLPIARLLADFSLPPWPDRMAKLAASPPWSI